MKTTPLFLFALVAATATASVGRAQVIVNGGFETPSITPGTFITIGPGGEPPGFTWTVSSGTVDTGSIPNAFVLYPAFEGSQVLDLNGVNRGAIFQDFATTPGQQYSLSFAYADNPQEGGVSSASVLLTNLIGGGTLLSTSVSHSTSTNGPPPNADWLQFSGSFTATGTTSRLAFASTSASNTASGGILLDAVSITVVPEPSSMFLLGLGAIALGRTMKRRFAGT